MKADDKPPSQRPNDADQLADHSYQRQPGEYPVGYDRPPKASQFKKGQSGNPRGRPKGTRNVRSALQKALTAKVVVRSSNRSRRVPAIVALHQQQLHRGLKGDNRAAANTFKAAKELGMFDETKLNELSWQQILSDEVLNRVS